MKNEIRQAPTNLSQLTGRIITNLFCTQVTRKRELFKKTLVVAAIKNPFGLLITDWVTIEKQLEFIELEFMRTRIQAHAV